MRAYFLQASDMSLELREVPPPKPGPDQLLVRVRAAGLNRGELLKHGLTAPGAAKIGGTEGAGEVDGTGQRVMGRLPSSFAEYALMDKADLIPVPANLSWEEAAATPLTFLVVYDMLVQQGTLKKDEWLLVTGVSSGVGVAALLAGKALGAKVIGTSGSEDKLKRLSAMGLDVAIRTRKPDFHDQVMKATGGKGVNLVVNNVGGSVFAECVKCLAYEGRLATVGYLDGVMKSEIDIDAQRRAARRHRRGLQARLPAALRQRQVEAGDRQGLRLQRPAGGQGAHAGRRPPGQDRRTHVNSGSGSQLVFAYALNEFRP
jgi:NADPH2:quinone reductase